MPYAGFGYEGRMHGVYSDSQRAMGIDCILGLEKKHELLNDEHEEAVFC